MNNSHVRILLLAGFAAATLTSCHDTSMSVDAMYGPENVLQAPLMNKEENHQFEKTNSRLYDEAVAESMFDKHDKPRTEAAMMDTAAPVHATDAAAMDALPAAAAASQSSDTVHGDHDGHAGHAEKK